MPNLIDRFCMSLSSGCVILKSSLTASLGISVSVQQAMTMATSDGESESKASHRKWVSQSKRQPAGVSHEEARQQEASHEEAIAVAVAVAATVAAMTMATSDEAMMR